MTSHRNSDPEDATDLIPTCRFMDNCDQLLIPGDCDACIFLSDEPRDEDGDPYEIAYSEHASDATN